MLFRRFVFGVLIRAVRNPVVQKKTRDLVGEALNRAQPSLIKATRTAGKLKRKTKQKLFDDKNSE